MAAAAGGGLMRAARRLATPGFVFCGGGRGVFCAVCRHQAHVHRLGRIYLWGTACKATKLGNALHAAAPGNVQAGSYNPGMMLLVYFFQFFWQGLFRVERFFAYDTLFAACMSAVAAPLDKSAGPRRPCCWRAAFAALVFLGPGAGGVSNIYCNVMGDLPLAFVFGGSMCLYVSLHRRAASGVLLAVTLGFFDPDQGHGPCVRPDRGGACLR